MRRTYRLDIEGKHPERLLEASKHDIRKYVRRERGKPLPAGHEVRVIGQDGVLLKVEAAG